MPQLVPNKDLLEWKPRDGWETLCKFLDKPVPGEPFPYANKGDDVAKAVIRRGTYRTARCALGKLFFPGLGFAAMIDGFVACRSVRG